MEKKKARTGGLGIVSLLTLIFIVLKLTKMIEWSWLWVLSPIWITAILMIVLFGTILVIGRIKKGKW